MWVTTGMFIWKAFLATLKLFFGIDKPIEEKVNEAKDDDAPDGSVYARPDRLHDWEPTSTSARTDSRSNDDVGEDGDAGKNSRSPRG